MERYLTKFFSRKSDITYTSELILDIKDVKDLIRSATYVIRHATWRIP